MSQQALWISLIEAFFITSSPQFRISSLPGFSSVFCFLSYLPLRFLLLLCSIPSSHPSFGNPAVQLVCLLGQFSFRSSVFSFHCTGSPFLKVWVGIHANQTNISFLPRLWTVNILLQFIPSRVARSENASKYAITSGSEDQSSHCYNTEPRE